MERKRITSGGPWEERVGYSRAVRAGNFVAVAGTTAALPDGTVFGGDDGYLQAKRAFAVALTALAEAGGRPADVVRTRMYVTDIGRWEEFARAHAELFGEVRPAATMVQVAALMTPGMLIEVEIEAALDG